MNTFFLISLTLLHSFQVLALSTDRDQPLHIESDKLDIDDQKGLSVYQGNVHVRQGSMHFYAEEISIEHPDKTVTKLLAIGQPAQFKQQQDNQEEVRATAQEIIWLADQDLLFFQKKVHVWQSGHEFRGEKMEYNLKNDSLKAEKSANGTGRVHVIIQPDTPSQEHP
jgi:lipopolysaccharide export system protein LptA